ncbi:hypothetical protein H6F93_15270 [Leptolyngbya sp. FACHB-671]|uniref:hypothetical protein n=1 Tax=Leptolyngbya sp. FACHB-671 TaxID=2692812 RepID=UPI001681E120|nr:hypothetical protein [Leptolyngbya sp. FACHB-671]MBD2068868.1 hypothetical protein [Leptolyngbya sp. FACHB-671]
MSNNLTQKFNQGERSAVIPGFPSSLRKKYSISIFILIILSVLNISLASDEVNSNIWSFSVELKVTSTTLFLVFLFWLPVLLPLLLTQFPQLQNSLTWLREQGIEEVETNLLKIKLRYGVQEASQSYEEKVWNPGATGANLSAQEVHQQIEKRYQDAIALVDAASNIDSVEALRRIDQLATYYDKVREEMPPGSNRTRLMRDISSTMWALVTKTTNFPVYERLISNKAGERMSAYKYLEWQPSIEYIDLLLSRAIGILEMPFGQYSALLALRRIVTTKELNSTLSKKTIDILHWSANLDYMGADRRRLVVEILSILETNA